MAFDKTRHHRRSIRWHRWNYAGQGTYFITTCSRNREHLFGRIEDGSMILSQIGQMIENTWLNLPSRFPSVDLDEFQVMPNHFHGILALRGEDDVPLGNVMKVFKSLAFRAHYDFLKDTGTLQFTEARIWQRNYWDHVVRDEQDLQKCRNYILNNPANWQGDDENLNRLLTRMTEHESE
jgi:REP element-mobilizing transposase RayT